AEEFKDQSKFIGIHFFSPVEKMMLVEIIVGKNTGDTALATALDYVRKNGKVFYDYPEKGKGQKSLWSALSGLQPKHLDPDTLDIEELKQRFLVVQAVEAARTVEDHVITDPREADVGSILGFG